MKRSSFSEQLSTKSGRNLETSILLKQFCSSRVCDRDPVFTVRKKPFGLTIRNNLYGTDLFPHLKDVVAALVCTVDGHVTRT